MNLHSHAPLFAQRSDVARPRRLVIALFTVAVSACAPDATDAVMAGLIAEWSARLSAATRRAEALVGR